MNNYYLKVWLQLTSGSFQIAFASRSGALLFIVAKLLRFIFLFLITTLVVTQTKTLAGYTLIQTLIFFLTYNLIDSISQLFFRDVYRFRQHIINGYFDYILIKPFNPLFKILLGGADPLDLLMLIPYTVLLAILLLQIEFSIISFILYILLVANGLLIATAFHIGVLALGILTTEIDHAIMIYRDITSMARFPVDIYREPLKAVITFAIPIGIMMTFPPKVLFGLLTPFSVIIALTTGILFFLLSVTIWKYALKKYSSASS